MGEARGFTDSNVVPRGAWVKTRAALPYKYFRPPPSKHRAKVLLMACFLFFCFSRAAFGVSRVPVPCTVLLQRHHALYSSESHELARKKAASRARGATIAAAAAALAPMV